MFLLWSWQLLQCGDWKPTSVLPPTKGRSRPISTPCFFPLVPSSHLVLWFYAFFSTGQVCLSALSWWTASTSVSEGVFLMCPRREMYSTCTYHSAILFTSTFRLLEIRLLWTFTCVSLGKHIFLHIVRWPWVQDLKQDSSKWIKGKGIKGSLTAWIQRCQNGN